ncbi:MAG: TolB protein [Actinomycetota bacterium]|jgi:hypothetical protein
MRRKLFVISVIATLFIVLSAPAGATVTGAEGLLVVARHYEGSVSANDEIWTLHADGADNHRLVGGFHPRWSADGTRIAFERAIVGSGLFIDIMKADGSGVHQLTSGTTPAWSPDDSAIALYDGNGIVIRSLMSSNAPRLIAYGGEQPDWGANGLIVRIQRWRVGGQARRFRQTRPDIVGDIQSRRRQAAVGA